MFLDAWELWFLKFDLPIQHHGTPHWPHALWPTSWPPKAPRPLAFRPVPELLFRHLMDQEKLKSLLWDMLKAQEDCLICLLCLLLLFVCVNFWAISISFCRLI